MGEPIPMVLHCPECRARHIDEGAFATKPHHTHACQSCGLTWRPSIEPTVGVHFLPGFKNEPDPRDARIAELEQRVSELEDALQPWRDANEKKVERIAELERVLGALVDALPRCEGGVGAKPCRHRATEVEFGYDGRVEYLCARHAKKRVSTSTASWDPEAKAAERELGRRK